MEYVDFFALFRDAFQKNSLPDPAEETVKAFYDFTAFLTEVNNVTNLTAIRDVSDIVYKHYVDSALLASSIALNARVLDLGCGPGFPSIPLAILRPDLTVVGLDSTQKKIDFLNQSAKRLGLRNLCGCSGRAEDMKTRKTLGTFDFVVSRAVARLNVLCELSAPYVRLGGELIAMKGARANEEVAEAKNAIQVLGFALEERRCFSLETKSDPESRSLIKIIKKKETPPTYPRAYATILKKPL